MDIRAGRRECKTNRESEESIGRNRNLRVDFFKIDQKTVEINKLSGYNVYIENMFKIYGDTYENRIYSPRRTGQSRSG